LRYGSISPRNKEGGTCRQGLLLPEEEKKSPEETKTKREKGGPRLLKSGGKKRVPAVAKNLLNSQGGNPQGKTKRGQSGKVWEL